MLFIISGLILLAVSFVAYMWQEKRVFERTSDGGIQQFESYSSLWKARFVEFGVKIIFYICLLSGGFLAVFGFSL